MEIFPFNKEKYIEFQKFFRVSEIFNTKILDKFEIDIKIS